MANINLNIFYLIMQYKSHGRKKNQNFIIKKKYNALYIDSYKIYMMHVNELNKRRRSNLFYLSTPCSYELGLIGWLYESKNLSHTLFPPFPYHFQIFRIIFYRINRIFFLSVTQRNQMINDDDEYFPSQNFYQTQTVK